MVSNRTKTIALAESFGCEIQETGDGSVYLNAPEGKQFANHGASFIRLWHGEEDQGRPSWKSFCDQVKDEIKGGLINGDEE